MGDYFKVVTQLSMCQVESAELIPLHQYSVDMFPYPGLSGILDSDGKTVTK